MQIGAATLLLGDCATKGLAFGDILLTDPPYGIGYRINERTPRLGLHATVEREAIHGDDTPFDPSPWLMFPKVAFFGAQHFSDHLPVGRWLVWDKRRESAQDSHSDCDLVWMTGDSREAMRVHRQKWRGVVREGEENCSRSKKLHPNQKPVALLTLILQKLDAQPGQTVVDPYMGSGSTAIAALRLGCKFIGCEIDPAHFETAQNRVRQHCLT